MLGVTADGLRDPGLADAEILSVVERTAGRHEEIRSQCLAAWLWPTSAWTREALDRICPACIETGPKPQDATKANSPPSKARSARCGESLRCSSHTLALLARDPHGRREEILRSLELMLPHALAQIEHDAPPAAAAGFERAVETVTHLARTAVRFEPVPPNRGKGRPRSKPLAGPPARAR